MRAALLLAAALGFLASSSALAQHDEPTDGEHALGEPAVTVGHEADAHGGEQHHADVHGEVTLAAILSSPTFRASVIAFLCLLILFARFARPAVRRGLKKRQRDIEQQLAEAARVKAEAEAMAREYAARLSRLDEEVKRVRDEMVAAAEAERDRMLREAEEKAALMRKDTRFQIEQRMKQLRVDLTREAVEAAIAAARTLLVEQSGPHDQSRLADEYLKQVATAAAAVAAKEERS